jgi:hypothetical protein
MVSAPMTLRFREHDRNAWVVQNVFLELYQPGRDGDWNTGEGDFSRLELRFHPVNDDMSY